MTHFSCSRGSRLPLHFLLQQAKSQVSTAAAFVPVASGRKKCQHGQLFCPDSLVQVSLWLVKTALALLDSFLGVISVCIPIYCGGIHSSPSTGKRIFPPPAGPASRQCSRNSHGGDNDKEKVGVVFPSLSYREWSKWVLGLNEAWWSSWVWSVILSTTCRHSAHYLQALVKEPGSVLTSFPYWWSVSFLQRTFHLRPGLVCYLKVHESSLLLFFFLITNFQRRVLAYCKC